MNRLRRKRLITRKRRLERKLAERPTDADLIDELEWVDYLLGTD